MAVPRDLVVIDEEGDAIMVYESLAQRVGTIGIVVSSHVLAANSPVFTQMLETCPRAMDGPEQQIPYKILDVEESDGDAMFPLLNTLHKQYRSLPDRLPIMTLYRLARLADKYQCKAGLAGPVLQGWFYELWHRRPDQGGAGDDTLVTVIEAAWLLDEPSAFARFTERWILNQFLHSKLCEDDLPAERPWVGRIVKALYVRQHQKLFALHLDLERLVEILTRVFSQPYLHYIDFDTELRHAMEPVVPNVPLPPHAPGIVCHVDAQAAQLYLGSMRDNGVWPVPTSNSTLQEAIDRLKKWEIPGYDDCDACRRCVRLKRTFPGLVMALRRGLSTHLWGLCLDCYNARGTANPGRCRLEHWVMPRD